MANEELLKYSSKTLDMLTPADVKNLVRKLQAHNIELENQNIALRRVQFELEMARDCYSEFYDFAPVGYVTICKDDIIRGANLELSTMLGVDLRELIGKPLYDFIAPEYQDTYYIFKKQLGNATRLQKVDLTLQKIDGSLFWVHMAAVVKKDTKNMSQIMISVTSINDYKIAEEDLRSSEAFLNEIINESSFAMWIADEKGTILRTNKALQGFLNLSDKQISGKYNVLEDQNLVEQGMMKQVKAVFEKGISTRFNMSWSSDKAGNVDFRGGGELWIDVSMFPIMDTCGKLKNVVCQWLDITKLKDAEEALKKSENKFRSITEQAADFIFIKDASRRYTFINHAMQNLLGLSEEKILGKTPQEIFGSEQGRVVDEVDDRTFCGEIVNETKCLNLKGTDYCLNTIQAPLTKIGRKVTSIMGIVRDVTAEKKIEEELRNSRAHLAELAHVQAEQLVLADKKLMESKRLSDIGALAATIAHELRNPLGVIRAAAYNIEKKSKNSLLKKHVVNIDKKIDESDQIIRNLLSFSRLKPPHYENVNILKLVNECIKNCKKKYSKWQISVIKKHNLKSKDIVEADPVQLTELFSNILDNAFQSFPSKKGKVELTVSLDKRGHRFDLDISDHGEGIAEKNKVKVFEPFYTTKARGTGLGLSVCKEIVNLYGGNIGITSRKHVGTSVKISLPTKRTVR